MTLLLVRNLCSAVIQSGFFKYPALKKSLKVLTSFFKGMFLWDAKGCPGKTKTHLYVPSFDDSNLIIIKQIPITIFILHFFLGEAKAWA